MQQFELFINKYFSVKSIKLSESSNSSYFIRINDDKAAFTQEFATELLRMMRDLRKLTYDFFIDSNDSINEAQKKADNVYLRQIDHTSDLKGMLYTLNLKKVLKSLANLVGFDVAPHGRYK
jgi:hypothetical protein